MNLLIWRIEPNASRFQVYALVETLKLIMDCLNSGNLRGIKLSLEKSLNIQVSSSWKIDDS